MEDTVLKRMGPGLAAAAAVSIMLTSCAVGTGTSGADDTKYDPNAKLSGRLQIMGFGAGDEIATTRFDLAKKALGDVKVDLIEGDLDMQQFLSSVAAGDPPELLYANRDQIGSLAARGAIMPLDRCIDGEGIQTDQFVKAAIDQVTFNGSVYGIPEFNSVMITMANADLLSAAGLTIDDVNGSDWDAVAAANKKLTKSDGGHLTVIGVDSKLPEFLPLWAKANGADLISEDGKKAQLNDPGVVQALEFAVGIYDAQGGFSAVKAYRDSADFFGGGNQYATGVLGSMWMEQWYLNVLNDVSPDAAMAFDTFRDPTGAPLAYASGSAWAIPAGSANPAASCRFARVMTEVDSWVAAAQARLDLRNKDGKPFTGVLTGNATADKKIQGMVTSGGEPWDSGVKAVYEANDHSFSLPANPADAEFKTAWQDAVNRVLNGQEDAKTALDKAQKEAQSALDQAWSKLEAGK
jgi:multiple sugar transport system substrate-binding protein